jgi:predicted nucleic acid-binding protein
VPIPYNERVSTELAKVLTELRRARTTAGLFDCIVAATALGAGLPVYTEDRDFEVLRDHDAGPDVVLG